MWEMTDFHDKLSQLSKVVLRCLEELNLLTWYLQCYLDPEVTIYFEQWMFMEELISLTKNGVNLKDKGENYRAMMS